MLIQRHNVAVRHVGVTMAGGRQVSQVNVELAHAGQEGFVCRTVAVDRGFLRFTHARQLIVGFIGAVVVQIVDHAFRVDVICGDFQTARTFRYRANIGDVAAGSR
ncbi:hypothetical protein D3C76_1623430 [compost metagenome]